MYQSGTAKLGLRFERYRSEAQLCPSTEGVFFVCFAAVLPAATLSRAEAAPDPISNLGLDAAAFGLRPGSTDDQSRLAQHAIDEAARAGRPLALAPGIYRVGNLNLPSGAQLMGVRGATKLVLGDGASLLSSQSSSYVTLSGLVFDGQRRGLPQGRGLLHFENARALKISDCEIVGAGGNALHCIASAGEIIDYRFADAVDTAIHSLNARGLLIARNTIARAGNNGIQVWRQDEGADGTIVSDNRIENIANRSGGSGQYGNAVNVFRAGNVIVRGNRTANCAFSAVRGNAASNLLIESNSISDAREVALYAEFGFEGAAIVGNIVDGSAIGVSVTNFNHGGRLAAVRATSSAIFCRGGPPAPIPTTMPVSAFRSRPIPPSLATRSRTRRPPVSCLAMAPICATSPPPETWCAGPALIANNMISDVVRGAVMGMDRKRIVTGDLMQSGAKDYRHITLAGNNFRSRPL